MYAQRLIATVCLTGLLFAQGETKAAKSLNLTFGVYTSEQATKMYETFTPVLDEIAAAVAKRVARPVSIELKIFVNQPFDRFFRSFGRYQDFFGGELEPELVTAGVHVVSLNSSRAFGAATKARTLSIM